MNPNYNSPIRTMKHKSEILNKLREMEDQYLYLRKLGKTPISADEYKLKAEALRWVLGEQETL